MQSIERSFVLSSFFSRFSRFLCSSIGDAFFERSDLLLGNLEFVFEIVVQGTQVGEFALSGIVVIGMIFELHSHALVIFANAKILFFELRQIGFERFDFFAQIGGFGIAVVIGFAGFIGVIGFARFVGVIVRFCRSIESLESVEFFFEIVAFTLNGLISEQILIALFEERVGIYR